MRLLNLFVPVFDSYEGHTLGACVTYKYFFKEKVEGLALKFKDCGFKFGYCVIITKFSPRKHSII